ncbi:MAG: hypothetical protein RBT59_03260 [Arcobacteraceae bacterium]|jgi:hypothetical protein|nr:hypothetical protein [Arcobacteraceae bacterium]
MKKLHQTHRDILRQIYNDGSVTAKYIKFSNANQYLRELENQKYIIREWIKGKKYSKLNPFKIKEIKLIIGVVL